MNHGSVVEIHDRGTFVFAIDRGGRRTLMDDFFIPVLDENMYNIAIRCGVCTMRDQRNHLLIEVTCAPNRLYKLLFRPIRRVCLIVCHVSDTWGWHARLGYQNFDGLRRMACDDLVCGVPQIEHPGELCEACLVGKQRCLPLQQKLRYRAENPLELGHGDLDGPVTPATPGG